MPKSARIFVEDGALFEPRSLEHLLGWAQRKGHDWHVQHGSSDEMSDFLADKSPGLRVMRLRTGTHPELMRVCGNVGIRVSRLGVLDFVRSSGDGWEADLLLETALHDVVVGQGKSLDLRESAYVIGDSGTLRAAAAVALGLGYRKVFAVAESERLAEEEGHALESLFLGADVSTILPSALTLQPGGASLLISTLNLELYPELSADLAYFNFMLRDGLVVDLTPSAEGKGVSIEADQAGLRVLPAFEVTAEYEMLFARKLGLDLSEDRAAFVASWFEVSGTKS